MCALPYCTSKAQIGTWYNHMAYHNIQQIEKAGNELFVMASNDVYKYNLTDHSITTYDKTNGLSDTHVKLIKWCQAARCLVVVYQNSNIDLLTTNGNAYNISDIFFKSLTGSKAVNAIYVTGTTAYLACDFGVVKIDVASAEISESYMLDMVVVGITTANGNIFIKTQNNEVWTADMKQNLIDKSAWHKADGSVPSFDADNDATEYMSTVEKLLPGGPKYNYFASMLVHNGLLYTVGGAWEQFGNKNRPGTVQIMDENGDWTVYEDDITPAFAQNYLDVSSIAIDPFDNSHVMVASCSGVYEFLNGKYQHNYTEGNVAYLSCATSTPNPQYVRCNGIIYDSQGCLYVLNSGADYAIVKRDASGKWSGIMNSLLEDKPNKSMRVMQGSIFDSRGLLWFCNAHSDNPALFCYNTETGNLVKYNTFINQDGSPITTLYRVFCVVEDKETNLWIGTDAGLFMYTPQQLSDASAGFTQVKVPRNDGTNYADYLLSSVMVSAIAVDGGNRKWIGTNGNGVYLISSDNMTQLHHFTAANSPLLSDNIESIAIHPSTGQVFFGTEEGLCSYMSDATEPSTEMTKDGVYAYPNPVTPEYTGLIAIKGLTMDADVKITNAAGVLINEGRSNGGTYTWNGRDKKGHRVASGVYSVMTATSSGKKGTVCKIAIIK